MLDSHVTYYPDSYDSSITTLPHRYRFSQTKSLAVSIDQRYFGSAQPDIERSIGSSSYPYCLSRFNSVGRNNNSKTRQ